MDLSDGAAPKKLFRDSADQNFTQDVINSWIEYTSASRNTNPVALRPHPYEFGLYYDVEDPGITAGATSR
jgi:glutamine synthetase